MLRLRKRQSSIYLRKSTLSLPMPSSFNITELSKEFCITTRTIRFYESEGLLQPERNGRNRVYSARDRVQLKLILRGKRLGFSLSEIADMISMYHAEPGEIAQLEYFLNRIHDRRLHLNQKRDDIELTLAELTSIEQQCNNRLENLKRAINDEE
jgi:DNA-binding transcriptional MerR regulator